MSRALLPARKSALRNELLTGFDSFFDSWLDDMFPATSSSFKEHLSNKGSYPKVNVVDLDDKVVIEAAIPGLNKEDVDIELDADGILTITGQSNQVSEYQDRFLLKEIKQSKFSRSFSLGKNIDKESIVAKCENGILYVELKKLKEEEIKPKVKKINIL